MPQGVAINVGGAPNAELADAASLIEVHERVGQATTYRLRYEVEISDGDMPLLTYRAQIGCLSGPVPPWVYGRAMTTSISISMFGPTARPAI